MWQPFFRLAAQTNSLYGNTLNNGIRINLESYQTYKRNQKFGVSCHHLRCSFPTASISVLQPHVHTVRRGLSHRSRYKR